jgi:hypothetical protein
MPTVQRLTWGARGMATRLVDGRGALQPPRTHACRLGEYTQNETACFILALS